MHLNGGYVYLEQLSAKAEGLTVLQYLSRYYTHTSEAQWHTRLQQGEVFIGNAVANGSECLRQGQQLVWHRPPWLEPDTPQHYGLIYQDDQLLAVNKPSGLPTVPAGGFLDNTLLTLVRRVVPSAIPLHRLGRGTSGLVLFAKNKQVASALSRVWHSQVRKTYLALASGVALQPEYHITTPIGPVPHPRLGEVHAASPTGKPSSSVARVLERRTDCTLFEVDIHTGRPHQIRIHLASVGHPLVADPLYGPDGLPLPHLPALPGDCGYWLHAARLELLHPTTQNIITLQAPAWP